GRSTSPREPWPRNYSGRSTTAILTFPFTSSSRTRRPTTSIRRPICTSSLSQTTRKVGRKYGCSIPWWSNNHGLQSQRSPAHEEVEAPQARDDAPGKENGGRRQGARESQGQGLKYCPMDKSGFPSLARVRVGLVSS